MIKKKIIFFILSIFFITSCADSWDSVKRGLTGKKAKTGDEFLVQNKDPLILPPDFDKLPTPDDRQAATEILSTFEQSLSTNTSSEDISSSSDSTEQSILKQIRKQ